eukprot:scaffold71376_cov62-Phaeocystis_antarctica.AAC.1
MQAADTEEGEWPHQGRPKRSRLIITAHELDTASLRVECVLAATRGREGDNLARAVLAAVDLAAGVQCIALLRGLPVHVRARSASACGELTVTTRSRKADDRRGEREQYNHDEARHPHFVRRGGEDTPMGENHRTPSTPPVRRRRGNSAAESRRGSGVQDHHRVFTSRLEQDGLPLEEEARLRPALEELEGLPGVGRGRGALLRRLGRRRVGREVEGRVEGVVHLLLEQ